MIEANDFVALLKEDFPFGVPGLFFGLEGFLDLLGGLLTSQATYSCEK
jgi:hypothetical protein